MWTRFSDFDRLLGFEDLDRQRALLDQWRRLGGLFEDSPAQGAAPASGVFPRTNLYDQGSKLVVTAEVPGLSEREVTVTLHQDVLTLAGERKVEVPAGYSVHRQERPPFRFSRSFTLPYRVDAERSAAEVVNGVLTVTMTKATESQPRQITVRAQ